MTLKQKSSALAIVVSLAVASWSASADQPTFITIGTGGVTGVYYPAGGAICRLVNMGRKEHGLRCSTESTGGSVYNLNAIREEDLDFAVAQSDWQYHAYNGTSQFQSDGANEKLRAVFSLHAEPFTVVASKGSGVRTFEDLQGKRVSLGNTGSGQRATAEVLLEEMGWTGKQFSQLAELKAADQSQALCDGKIDAFFYTVGHPSGAIKEATTSCDSVLVNVDNNATRTLIDDNPYYREATIPGGMYRGSEDDVITFGVAATVVSSSDVSEDIVYEVVKAVFENFDSFKRLHPAFANLQKKEMISDALTAPLHPGAARYYREADLIE